MKYIVLAIPGAADIVCEELSGKTPFQVAKIPNLNHITRIGKVGTAKLMPERPVLSSDASLLSLLGYDAQSCYTGIGPLEAAHLELELEENEIPFRMNFITESAGNMADPTAGSISTKEARALITYLNKKISSDFVKFYPGTEYRHIAVLKDAHGFDALSARTTSPDAIVGDELEKHFPKGPGEQLLKKMMYDARLLLQDHEVNQVRLDLHENPANMIWLWGQGRQPQVDKFESLFGLKGTMIADIEYAKGAARLAGLDVFNLADPADDQETVFDLQGEAMNEVLGSRDFVCLLINACDEASRRGDLKGKISALEAVDFFVISRVREYMEKNKDCRVLISPCHVTSWKTKQHKSEEAPFVIAGKNLMPDDVEKFSEIAAKTSEVKMENGKDLMPYFLDK